MYGYALKILSYQSLSTAELKKRLLERTHEESLVNSVLDRLTSQGYLDDRRFIEGFVFSRRESKHYGRKRIELELRLKGLDSVLVGDMLEQLYPADEDQLQLRKNLEKKLKSLGPPMDAKKAARLYNYLIRRGFARDAAFREIRRRFKEVDLTE